MRSLLIIAVVGLYSVTGFAQYKSTREETVKWLIEKLAVKYARPQDGTIGNNATAICRVDSKVAQKALNDRDFSAEIVSFITWKDSELQVQNDIFEHAKLRETYTYKVPLSAITGAHMTNCQRNDIGFVNAYRDRPILIHCRNKSTTIAHVRFDKYSHALSGKSENYQNNSDTDWNSYIPIAGNWDKDSVSTGKVLAAFARLSEINNRK